ncbi:MAG: diphosphomevalonate decarboxylase, partial [Anaerolineae bacterium]|nr:diphosphomevalonate decarboxylase [Anaerolineae bacterium]
MKKVTAVAHPIQGLIKYHGFRDVDWRLPLHDSISVCTAPFETRTTLEIRPDLNEDAVEIDGQAVDERTYRRVERVLRQVRQVARREERVLVRSQNSFPSNIGLGASASGFAALAVAANGAYEAGLSKRQLSTVARLGAGSASRA